MGYFTVEVKPTIASVTAGQSTAFAQNDVLFDWYAFDVPKGTCRLLHIDQEIRPKGDAGATVNEVDLDLLLAKANQNGTAHIDNHLPNTFTFLYYPNLEWHWLWNGALFFLNATASSLDSQTDILKTVSFKPNRAVYFSSNMCHYAEAPSNIFKDLRVSIAWKLSKYL